MKKLSLVLCVLCGSVTAALAASPDMTLDFTWIGTDLCTPLPRSPKFQVENTPVGTHRLQFVLTSPDGRELGRADVALPPKGNIPKGAIGYSSPCVGGMYTWTVNALGADGKLLASAQLTRPFH